MPGRAAVLVVNGFVRSGRWGTFDQREPIAFPWIELCLAQVERHSQNADYRVVVYDNSQLDCHRAIVRACPRATLLPDDATLARAASGRNANARLARLVKRHPAALDHLVAGLGDDIEYVITLDTDAFPIRDGWIEALTGALDGGARIAGVYRDEMAPKLTPFIHVSCLCIRLADLRRLRSSFARQFAQDVGQNITTEVLGQGGELAPLRRSNGRNAHFLMGGLYGDLVYHHGAGSRRAVFWTSTDVAADERCRIALRDAVFADVDRLVACLRGEGEDPYGWDWLDSTAR